MYIRRRVFSDNQRRDGAEGMADRGFMLCHLGVVLRCADACPLCWVGPRKANRESPRMAV